MPALTEPMLDKLATEVVENYFTTNVPLTESVVKVAERENLNPEHIKRLVEATNNMTFLRKFSAAEPGADRMVDFETADASSAIQRMLDAAKDLMAAMPEGPEGGCPMDDLPMTREGAPEPLPEAEPEATEEPKVNGQAMIMKLRKTGALLQEKHYQKRVELTERLQKLATVFTRANGPSFELFEKDAFYHWGSRAAPCLQVLRATLRKPAAEYNHGALTKVARVVDASSPEMREFIAMVKCSNEIANLQFALEKSASYLKQLEQ